MFTPTAPAARTARTVSPTPSASSAYPVSMSALTGTPDGGHDPFDRPERPVPVEPVAVRHTQVPGQSRAGGSDGSGARLLDDTGAHGVPGVGEDERPPGDVQCAEGQGLCTVIGHAAEPTTG